MTITCDRCGIDLTLEEKIDEDDVDSFRIPSQFHFVRRRTVRYAETVCQCGAVIRLYPTVGGGQHPSVVGFQEPKPEPDYGYDRDYY